MDSFDINDLDPLSSASKDSGEALESEKATTDNWDDIFGNGSSPKSESIPDDKEDSRNKRLSSSDRNLLFSLDQGDETSAIEASTEEKSDPKPQDLLHASPAQDNLSEGVTNDVKSNPPVLDLLCDIGNDQLTTSSLDLSPQVEMTKPQAPDILDFVGGVDLPEVSSMDSQLPDETDAKEVVDEVDSPKIKSPDILMTAPSVEWEVDLKKDLETRDNKEEGGDEKRDEKRESQSSVASAEEFMDFSVLEMPGTSHLNVDLNKHKRALSKKGSISRRKRPTRAAILSSGGDNTDMFRDSTEPKPPKSPVSAEVFEEKTPVVQEEPKPKESKKMFGGIKIPGLLEGLSKAKPFSSKKSQESSKKDKKESEKEPVVETVSNPSSGITSTKPLALPRVLPKPVTKGLKDSQNQNTVEIGISPSMLRSSLKSRKLPPVDKDKEKPVDDSINPFLGAKKLNPIEPKSTTATKPEVSTTDPKISLRKTNLEGNDTESTKSSEKSENIEDKYGDDKEKEKDVVEKFDAKSDYTVLKPSSLVELSIDKNTNKSENKEVSIVEDNKLVEENIPEKVEVVLRKDKPKTPPVTSKKPLPPTKPKRFSLGANLPLKPSLAQKPELPKPFERKNIETSISSSDVSSSDYLLKSRGGLKPISTNKEEAKDKSEDEKNETTEKSEIDVFSDNSAPPRKQSFSGISHVESPGTKVTSAPTQRKGSFQGSAYNPIGFRLSIGSESELRPRGNSINSETTIPEINGSEEASQVIEKEKTEKTEETKNTEINRPAIKIKNSFENTKETIDEKNRQIQEGKLVNDLKKTNESLPTAETNEAKTSPWGVSLRRVDRKEPSNQEPKKTDEDKNSPANWRHSLATKRKMPNIVPKEPEKQTEEAPDWAKSLAERRKRLMESGLINADKK